MTHISWYFMIVLSNPFNTIFFGNSPTWSNIPRASLRTCGRFQLCTSCRTTTSGSSGCSQMKRRPTSKTYEKWWKLVTFYSFSALCHVVPWKEMQSNSILNRIYLDLQIVSGARLVQNCKRPSGRLRRGLQHVYHLIDIGRLEQRNSEPVCECLWLCLGLLWSLWLWNDKNDIHLTLCISPFRTQGCRP